MSDLVSKLLNKSGLDKSSVEKSGNIIDQLIYMLTAIHILGCFWIYIGNCVECSWLDQRPDNPGGLMCQAGIPVDRENSKTVYVLAVYFIVTTLVTVGYGDYKGYTPTEYLF